jgi:DNA-binding GntR family transcriptional regulator
VSLAAALPGPDAGGVRAAGSLSVRVYDTLRRGIILGDYPQGMRLAEQRLAEELSVSRVPLREAIPQLEVDGFVQTLPRRCTQVTRWTRRSVNDLFDVRLGLEVSAAGYAARNVASGASTTALRESLDYSHQTLDAGDAYLIADASSSFHEQLVDLAGNELLSSLMRAVAGRVAWLFYLTSQLDPDAACAEHHELLDAIESGNPRVAEALAYSHIEKGRKPSFEALRDLPDD